MSSEKGTKAYTDLCKRIQKLTRARSRSLKSVKIKRILDNFCGVKHIPRIRTGGKIVNISCLLDSAGIEVSDKNSIAAALADFC